MEKNPKKLIENSKAVIFDVDGLLINSEPAWDETHLAFFEKYNLQGNPELIEQTMGMGVKDSILLFQEKAGLQGDIATLMKEIRNLFYSFFYKNAESFLMEGARELVQTLSGKKILAIATGGHTVERMEEMLQELHLRQYFSVVVSSDLVEKGKPAPDVFVFTAKKLGINPQDCVVLEDSVNGVLAARGAHIPVIGVNKNPILFHNLVGAKADVVISSLQELL